VYETNKKRGNMRGLPNLSLLFAPNTHTLYILRHCINI